MQISFLKDFATLRNPASPFTFLQYLKARDRLEQFVNLRDFHPTRVEYHDYMSWVAEAFAEQIRYLTAVTRVTPIPAGRNALGLFRVEARNVASGEHAVYFARNVVCATGGRPRLPPGVDCGFATAMHSSDFLPRFPQQFPARDRMYDFAIAGDGQSAGEVAAFILGHYPQARVHMLVSRAALRPADSSPFVNEQFYSSSAQAFFGFSPDKRAALRDELRGTNNGVIEPELIDALYKLYYLDEVKGRRRLFIHPHSRLAGVKQDGDRLCASVEHGYGEPSQAIACDGIVFATGYERSLDPSIFADVLVHANRSESGELGFTRSSRVQTSPELVAGLYVQGCGESSFGPGDALLSLLPFRSRDIFMDICAGREPQLGRRSLPGGQYPPRRHLEDDRDKLFSVMERCSFATLISVRDGEPVVTHVPMTLDRARGSSGVLFGHMDRSNPHVDLLDGCRILALFHGPNAFISPHVYHTPQLPTWNSITVHVRGVVRVVDDRDAVVLGLCRIAQCSDPRPDAYRLLPGDPRVGPLLDYIVGFEIEIDEMIGRFKLSQDRDEGDRSRAALALARRSEAGERDLIERIVGASLAGGPLKHVPLQND